MTEPRNNLLVRYGQRVRTQLVAWATEQTTPARTALGLATGIFIGIIPSFAVGSLIALYLAGRFGLHRGAALAGTFLMNPITAPIFYSLSYAVGAGFAVMPVSASSGGVLASIQQLGWAFLLGNAIVALASATLLGLAVFFWMRYTSPRATSAESSLEVPVLTV